MTAIRLLLFVGLAVAVAGCGSPQPAAVTDAETPLTLQDWKAMPAPAKYEIDTLERLKLSDPKFREQRSWDKFTREVLLPAKKKDMPSGQK